MQGRITCNGNTQFFDLPNSGGSGQVVSANTWTRLTNCAVANPVNMNCNTLMIEIEGQGISSRHISCSTMPTGLPIVLLGFDAQARDHDVHLTWATASEERNAYFIVERSADGELFDTLVTVTGAGDSQSTRDYEAIDPNPLPGTSYYRLRQVDHDGSATTYDIVPVYPEALVWQPLIVPNPASGDAFQVQGPFEEHAVTIRDLTGTIVHSAPRAGRPVFHPTLSKGIYLVHLTPPGGGAEQVVRLVQE